MRDERKFDTWEELSHGGCRYFHKIAGHYGWSARYVKEVDELERTIKFHQEIYDHLGRLVELHEKYPTDKGHIIITGD